MVTLLGGHTVGITHCSLFKGDRLSRADGSMDTNLFNRLRKTCSSRGDPSVFLDQNTSFVVDNSFYKQLRLKKGILKVDQLLASDKSTAGIVSNFAANPRAFQQAFANALIKLGNTQVLTGKSGEIRRNCRSFNPPQLKSPPPPPPKILKSPPPPPPKVSVQSPPPPPKVSFPPPSPLLKVLTPPPPPPPKVSVPPSPPPKVLTPPPPPPPKVSVPPQSPPPEVLTPPPPPPASSSPPPPSVVNSSPLLVTAPAT